MASKKRHDDDDKTVEQEIEELQRRFRILENDKRAYSENSQGLIRKQRNAIEKLTKENRAMKQELSDWRASTTRSRSTKGASEQLHKLDIQKTEIEQSEIRERERNAKLLKQIDDTKKRMKAVREEMAVHGGVTAARDNAEAVAKQIRVLENRLDKALQKFNLAVAANKSLRDQIDGLRRERVVFDNIYKKLEQELSLKKREMANIIEQANAAYEARDSAQAQMATLKQQADKEHQDFEKEWRELGRLIENDKRLKQQMREKEHKRLQEEARNSAAGGLNLEEDKMKTKVMQSAWGVAKDRASVSFNLEKIQTYEEAFARIMAATGISDIDELVQNFLNAEDQNFSLFNYANELQSDLEKLEQEIGELSEELEHLKGLGSTQTDEQRKQLQFAELEEQRARLDKQAEQYELKYQQALKALTAVRAGVQSVFNRLGCKPPAGAAVHGESGVTDSNMMLYLATIEKRTNEILQLHAALNQNDDDQEEQAVPAKTHTGTIQPRPPSTVDDYSDDDDEAGDDDTRPLTKEELHQRSLRGLQKKLEKGRKRK